MRGPGNGGGAAKPAAAFDMHIHSFHSDGMLAPETLVKEAQTRGVQVMAVTDHDNVNGVAEAVAAGQKYGVTVIPGIELSTGTESGMFLHLLGYGIDVDNQPLRRTAADILDKRRQRNVKMRDTLEALGYPLTMAELKVVPQQTYAGKPNFARAMVKRGYVSQTREAFQDGGPLGRPEVRAIHKEKIDTFAAINLIKEAGGVPVLAHPLKISYAGRREEKHYFAKLETILAELVAGGLEGMEAYYSRHIPYETERLLQLADHFGLKVTAGSDFHGPEYDPNVRIGGFQVPLEEKRLAWIRELG